MNKILLAIGLFSIQIFTPSTAGEETILPELRLPPIPPDDPAFITQGPLLTDEDLADPPPGEIRKMYVHHIKGLNERLSENLNGAPPGPDGQDSPWMPKLRDIKESLDLMATTRLQSDVFAAIPKMREVFEAAGTPGFAPFFSAQGGLIRDAGFFIIHAIAEHVSDRNGDVADADLTNFVAVFAVDGFVLWNDWEDEEMPIEAAGLMIINPGKVTAQLKTLPWRQVENFTRNQAADVAFAPYEAEGRGLPVLKAKYATHKAEIHAKWKELLDFAEQRREVDR